MDELTTAFLSTALQLSTPIGLAVLAFIVGKWVEVEHLEDLDRRETATKPTLALSLKRPPEALSATEGRMVTGSVVISLDYFNSLQDTTSMVFTKQYGFRFSSAAYTELAPRTPVLAIDFSADEVGVWGGESRTTLRATRAGTVHAVMAS